METIITTPFGPVMRSAMPGGMQVRHPGTGEPVQAQITIWMDQVSRYVFALCVELPGEYSETSLVYPDDCTHPSVMWLIDNGHLTLGVRHG